MIMRNTFLRLGALLFLVLMGCEKAAADSSTPAPGSLQETITKVHWQGKRRLGVEASAYYLMRIWDLPDSKRLEAQTLNKLSAAPASIPPAVAQSFSMVLRPLLSDALQEECYLALRHPADRPTEIAFAIRLSSYQDGFWETNLAVLAESITGTPAVPISGSRRGWVIKRGNPPNLIEMFRDGDWTFIGVAQDQNSLLQETVAEARRSKNPFCLEPGADNWLEAQGNLQPIANALNLGSISPTNSPRYSVAVNGDGGNVLVHGDLVFPHAFQAANAPWDVPTNLIRGRLTSFTAARGIQPLIASSKSWTDLSAFLGNLAPPPDQLYFWSQARGQFQTFFAVPAADASQRVNDLTEKLMNKANPWLNSRGYVGFERRPGSNGFTWGNLAMGKPFLMADKVDGFVLGGLSEGSLETNSAMDPAPLQHLSGQTNLVLYDWEMTGTRVEPWLYLSQVTRNILHRPSLSMESAGLVWLGTIKLRLGETDTQIAQTGTNRLSFTRKSTLGLTAPELHLFVDWLESPQFPTGL